MTVTYPSFTCGSGELEHQITIIMQDKLLMVWALAASTHHSNAKYALQQPYAHVHLIRQRQIT